MLQSLNYPNTTRNESNIILKTYGSPGPLNNQPCMTRLTLSNSNPDESTIHLWLT